MWLLFLPGNLHSFPLRVCLWRLLFCSLVFAVKWPETLKHYPFANLLHVAQSIAYKRTAHPQEQIQRSTGSFAATSREHEYNLLNDFESAHWGLRWELCTEGAPFFAIDVDQQVIANAHCQESEKFIESRSGQTCPCPCSVKSTVIIWLYLILLATLWLSVCVLLLTSWLSSCFLVSQNGFQVLFDLFGLQ